MPERDWQKDWELCHSLEDWRTWDSCEKIAQHVCRVREASKALAYWLQRVRELEDENRELRDVLETLVKNSVSPFKNGEPDCGQYDGYFNGLKKAREILGRTRLEVEK